MPKRRTAIWIQPAQPALPPTLFSGEPQRIERVMQALRGVRELSSTRSIVDSGRVQALEVSADEATLTLRIGLGLCHEADLLAELAFEALRVALPDTDLYLRHDRAPTCASVTEPAVSAPPAVASSAHMAHAGG